MATRYLVLSGLCLPGLLLLLSPSPCEPLSWKHNRNDQLERGTDDGSPRARDDDVIADRTTLFDDAEEETFPTMGYSPKEDDPLQGDLGERSQTRHVTAGSDEGHGSPRGNVKRKWGENYMSVWGKREEEKDKRKWGDNSMSVWGKRTGGDVKTEGKSEKRKWGENTMSVWGKRDDSEKDKRKWGENTMSVWGKRSSEGEANKAKADEKNSEPSGGELYKPETSTHKVKGGVRGHELRNLRKRSISESGGPHMKSNWFEDLVKKSRPRWSPISSTNRQMGGPKRNWETNTMKVWGKRGSVWSNVPDWEDYPFQDDDDDDAGDWKRQWSSSNPLRVWGKRNDDNRRLLSALYGAYEDEE